MLAKMQSRVMGGTIFSLNNPILQYLQEPIGKVKKNAKEFLYYAYPQTSHRGYLRNTYR